MFVGLRERKARSNPGIIRAKGLFTPTSHDKSIYVYNTLKGFM